MDDGDIRANTEFKGFFWMTEFSTGFPQTRLLTLVEMVELVEKLRLILVYNRSLNDMGVYTRGK